MPPPSRRCCSRPMAALHRQPVEPHRAFGRRRCARSSIRSRARLDESREIVRYLAGPAGLPRPARHLLGPASTPSARSARIIQSLRTGHGCRRPVRRAEERRSPAPLAAAWACRSRPRCSALPARWCSASSTSRPARRRTASTPSSRTGSPPSRPWTPPAPTLRPRPGTSDDLDAGAQPAHRGGQRRRRRARRDAGHGQPRRGHPGPGPAHARRAADDPRLGRGAGRRARRS